MRLEPCRINVESKTRLTSLPGLEAPREFGQALPGPLCGRHADVMRWGVRLEVGFVELGLDSGQRPAQSDRTHYPDIAWLFF